MSPPVILVDWYNTLSTSKFWQQWASSFHPMNNVFETIQTRWLSVDRPRVASWMRGQLTSEQFNAALAHDLGLDFADLHAAFIRSCVEMRLDAPEVRLSVTRIRENGGKVYIATDNMDSLGRWTVPALGLETVFDAVLSSHQVGYLKEDIGACGVSAFFKTHLEQRGHDPGDCLLIDDSETTCRAANALGIRTHRVSSPGEAAAILRVLAS